MSQSTLATCGSHFLWWKPHFQWRNLRAFSHWVLSPLSLGKRCRPQVVESSPDVNTHLSKAKAVPLQKLLNIITDPGIPISGLGNLLNVWWTSWYHQMCPIRISFLRFANPTKSYVNDLGLWRRFYEGCSEWGWPVQSGKAQLESNAKWSAWNSAFNLLTCSR